MARETVKSLAGSRTEELRREITQSDGGWVDRLKSRRFALTLLIWGLFTAGVGAVSVWTREQPLVAVDRVMSETRTVRASFEVVDAPATEQAKNAARQRAARVYIGDAAALEELATSLENLPLAMADVVSVGEIEPGLRQQFGITEDSIDALRGQLTDGKVGERWAASVRRLHELMIRMPILEKQAYQVEVTSQNTEMELRLPDSEGQASGEPKPGSESRATRIRTGLAHNVESQELPEALRTTAMRAGFSGVLLDVVAARLTWQLKPTYTFDAAATAAEQEAAAQRVPPQIIKYPDREVIFRRGDVLTPTQLSLLRASREAERRQEQDWRVVAGRLSIIGIVTAVALAMAGYAALFCVRVRRNAARMAGLAGLMAGAAAVACFATASQPGLSALTAIAPTVFVAVILCIAYDQRTALAFGWLHGILVCAALGQPIGAYAAMVCGVGVAVWQLRDVRDRDTIIRMGVVEGLSLAAAVFVTTMVELPMTDRAIFQAAWDAGLAGFAGLLVAGITLYILPTLERIFDITTGMSLVELRDPKQPLLRQLQQRAPGTYNHSLNLASLGEAAAEAIGANGLLTYVGALYHDIGKMNKPDYFVENQTPGINKHDKLSPAMSLLIIVGHVKDGMELAREFGLPRPLWHFIESHHGTTLVEYFYHRARKQAEAASAGAPAGGAGDGSGGAGTAPTELEYRYPGPRPRSKEAAIVMLCDAVESASRAMADPTPARIDATVRAIATKRLMDGQFDECDITLRELNVIVETVSKTLASIYHGRIAYPGGFGVGGMGGSGIGSDGPRTRMGVAVVGPASGVVGSPSSSSSSSGEAVGVGVGGGAGVATTRLPAGAMSPVEGAGGRRGG